MKMTSDGYRDYRGENTDNKATENAFIEIFCNLLGFYEVLLMRRDKDGN